MEVYGNLIGGLQPKYENESKSPSSQGAIFEIEFYKNCIGCQFGDTSGEFLHNQIGKQL